MRQPVVAVLLLMAVGAAAQGPAPHHAAHGRGHFGAPVLKYTVVRSQGAVLFGGRGGVNLTPSLVLGGSLYGTMNEVDARAVTVPDAPGPLDVKFETFGLELEYAVHPAAPTHLKLGALLGGAVTRYARDKTDEQHGETDAMLLLEPSVGAERGVANWFHLHLSVSYRLVSGVEQRGLEDGDFTGPAVALAAKLGQF
ncbi:MAG: hypothetical protein AB1505_09795 [Candidatus Latescibacterota bacterium]